MTEREMDESKKIMAPKDFLEYVKLHIQKIFGDSNLKIVKTPSEYILGQKFQTPLENLLADSLEKGGLQTRHYQFEDEFALTYVARGNGISKYTSEYKIIWGIKRSIILRPAQKKLVVGGLNELAQITPDVIPHKYEIGKMALFIEYGLGPGDACQWRLESYDYKKVTKEYKYNSSMRTWYSQHSLRDVPITRAVPDFLTLVYNQTYVEDK